jgi:hypothetical protein
MLYVNDEKIDLNKIKGYRGTDSVLKKLSDAYEKIDQLGFPIKLRCDKLQSGSREGKKGIFLPYSGEVETDYGTAVLVYAQAAQPDKNGVSVKYRPRGEKFEKPMTIHNKDVDKLLFFMLACPLFKAGVIYIEDLEEKARQVATLRASSSALTFYLYNESSPIYNDVERLCNIAAALGIAKPEILGLNEIRNAIFDRVEAAEKIHDKTYGYKWFNSAVSEFSPKMEALTVIQRATDLNLIKYNPLSFRWFYLDSTGKEMKVICPVEPHNASLNREILAAFLIKNKETYETIQEAMKAVRTRPMNSDTSVALSREGDSEQINFEELSWNELRKLATANNVIVKGRSKQDIIKELEYRRQTII